MNKSAAIFKINEAISDDSQVITPKGRDYDEYVIEVTDKLIANVIEPVKANVTSACFPEYYLDKYQSSEVWCIAQCKDNWLLTIASENEFALGFGDSPNNIMMLGFSSSDVLAEWLG
ncbi:hypothetical protein ACM9HF_04600 [Colwellia sp. RE-S-Sl-9]